MRMQNHFCSLSAGAFELLLAVPWLLLLPCRSGKLEKNKRGGNCLREYLQIREFEIEIMGIDIWVCILLLLKVIVKENRGI